MAQKPIDPIDAFVIAMRNGFAPLVTAFNQLAESLAQAFSATGFLYEAFERVRVAEEERQRRAMMARITRRAWQATAWIIGMVVFAAWWIH